MASSTTTPLLSSPPSSLKDLQQYWLNNSTKAFLTHLHNDINLPTCIFQLPETLISEQPHSYIPQHIGLGPIHHFRTDLYTNQTQLKITTSKTLLKPYQTIPEFQKTLHKILTDLIPVTRSCYELYFDVNDECLSWVFVLDTLFLLNALSKVSNGQPLENWEDFIMVENQIPLVILLQLATILHQQSIGDSDDESFVSRLLVKFCETRSPLKFKTLENQLDLDVSNTFHLLDCMYQLIVNHNLAPKNHFLRTNFLLDVGLDDVENVVQIAGGLFPGANVFLRPVLNVLKLPWDKVITLIKKWLGEKPTTVEINIPSVSKLSKIGKVEFCSTLGGIHDVKFDEEKPSISLPVLELKCGSEVVLRNLIAYESLMFKNDNITNLDLTEYVDLMCGIIDGVKDVKILRERNVIEGDMGDEEVVKLFNGISKSSAKIDGKKSELQKTIGKVNGYYGNIPRLKVFNVIKKVFLASWKIFAFVFAVLSLVLMIVTGVCGVFDCSGSFGLVMFGQF
ncbi:hypothetical protein L1987_01525 [Smallanthus sonchifolius]|uniref:Uncharacterized protein n=1 Tax=Smallanthus sonchifolius TaxID=185202 RepID=A0ACB9K5J4_9ASTR|nr:hypothetical protein L1987_01525 [Smallanthus sonchifolius]